MHEVIAPRTIAAIDDEPAFFEAGDETLFGIHTRPAQEDLGSALIMLPSAEPLGYHRNRIGVALAHRLSECGHHAFRIDYRGLGESTGRAGRFRLDEPFTADAIGATAYLRDRGVERFFYSGLCFGARVGLAAAVDEPAVAGVIAGSMPVNDYAQGERGSMRTAQTPLQSLTRQALRRKTFRDLRDADLRRLYGEAVRYKLRRMVRRSGAGESVKLSSQLVGFLEPLVERRVPLLFLYGETDGAYAGFLEAVKGELGDLLRKAGNAVEVAVVPNRLHGFVSVSGQPATIDVISDWISRVDR